MWPHLSDIRKQDFYNNYLIAVCKFCKKNRIQSAIQEYESHIPQSKWDNLTLANAHLIIEDFDRAEYFASQYKLHTSIDSDSRYYAILYFLCRAQGKYKEAGEAYSRFNHINDSLNISALQENVRLTEARHQQELLNKESELNQIRNLWITVCGIVLLLLIILFISYRLRISRMQKRLIEQEKEQYRRLYEQLEEEYQGLQLLLQENNRLNDETKDIVKNRLDLLNDFIKAHLAEKGNKAEMRIRQIMEDKEAFMQSTCQSFSISHPVFIQKLRSHDLTDWEVGYCCLYALGLSSKEVGHYINSSTYYKTNSMIRKKLGLDSHCTNLNLYIKQMLEACESAAAPTDLPSC